MQNTTCCGPIVSAGCDWLTLTEREGTNKCKQLETQIDNYLLQSSALGAGLKDSAPQGYHGVGNEFGFRGFRDGIMMVRVSGKNASFFLELLKQTGEQYHVTRIDTQCTIEYPGPVNDFASKLLGGIRQRERRSETVRRVSASLYQSDDRDTGVTLGSRAAETFTRAYHPRRAGHIEFSDNAIRFEIEYKGDRARQVYAMAHHAASVPVLAVSLVTGELLARGVQEFWFGETSIPPVRSDFLPTDQARRFEWFKASVAPALEKLWADEFYCQQVDTLLESIRRRSTNDGVKRPLNRRGIEIPWWAEDGTTT